MVGRETRGPFAPGTCNHPPPKPAYVWHSPSERPPACSISCPSQKPGCNKVSLLLKPMFILILLPKKVSNMSIIALAQAPAQATVLSGFLITASQLLSWLLSFCHQLHLAHYTARVLQNWSPYCTAIDSSDTAFCSEGSYSYRLTRPGRIGPCPLLQCLLSLSLNHSMFQPH